FLSKGNSSRFVGSHALQAMLLGLAILFVQVPLVFLARFLDADAESDAMATTRLWTVVAVACAMPLGSCLWWSLPALAGRPASAPVVGRWVKETMAPPRDAATAEMSAEPAEATPTPENRVIAGLAYVSTVPLFVVGPLLIYLRQRTRSRFVAAHAL